jgi:hypothetical protein
MGLSVRGVDAKMPSPLLIRTMTTADAEQVAGWRYVGRWAVYDLASAADIVDNAHLYRAVTDADGALVGFFCVGAAARVRELDPDPHIVDVGLGLAPELVGQGRGALFGQTVLSQVSDRFPGCPLRIVVQAWNMRSRRLAGCLGFADIGELHSGQVERQICYRLLMKPSG